MEHVIAVPSSPAAAPAVAPAFISSGDGPLLPIGGRPLSTVPAPDGSGARTLRGLPPALPPPPPAPYAFRETAERFLEKSKQQTLEMKARGEAALAAQASRFDGVMKDTVAHFVAQISTVKEEANKRVSELQAAVSAAEAAAMEAQVQAAQVLAETIAEKDLAMERLRSASEVKQAGLNSELAAANARAEALQATVDSLSVQLSASTSDISAMKDAAEREVVTLTGVINSAMAVLSSPMAASVTDDGGGHPLLLAIAKLVHCVRVRDDAVRALELEKEELASLVLTQSHSAVVPAPPMPQRTGFPLETATMSMVFVEPVPVVRQPPEAPQGTPAKVSVSLAPTGTPNLATPNPPTDTFATPLKALRVAQLASGAGESGSPGLLNTSGDGMGGDGVMMGTPLKPASDVADDSALDARLTLSKVIMHELKAVEAGEERDEHTKTLNSLRGKIRDWMAAFEAKEGRKPEKSDKRAIKADFLALREVEKRLEDSEEVFKDVTTAAANLRQEYKTVAAEADAAPLMGILTALSVEARAAIRTAKKLWSEKQKRLSLAFLQKVVAEFMARVAAMPTAPALSQLEACLEQAVANSELSAKSKPIQAAVSLRKGLDSFVALIEQHLGLSTNGSGTASPSQSGKNNEAKLLARIAELEARLVSPKAMEINGSKSPRGLVELPSKPQSGPSSGIVSPRSRFSSVAGDAPPGDPADLEGAVKKSLATFLRHVDPDTSTSRERKELEAGIEAMCYRLRNIEPFSKSIADGGVDVVALRKQQSALEARLAQEQLQRKRLSNQLDDNAGKVRVLARCRPPTPAELSRGECKAVSILDDCTIRVNSRSSGPCDFVFNDVFPVESTTDQVFGSIKASLSRAVDGGNVCVMSAGAGKTGKSFTLFGQPYRPGLLDAILHELFTLSKSVDKSLVNLTLEADMVEICGDDVTDLFNVTGGQPVAVIPTEEPGGFRLVNAFRVVLPSAEKAAETLQTGVDERRAPSHVVTRVHVVKTDKSTRQTTEGCVWLVDIGSRSAPDGGGDKAKVMHAFNRSVTSFETMIAALSTAAPYSSTDKLVQLLGNTVGGCCSTTMIVHVSPAEQQVADSMASLSLAAKARQIQNKSPAEAASEEVIRLQRVIDSLRIEGTSVGFVSGPSGGAGAKFTRGIVSDHDAVIPAASVAPSRQDTRRISNFEPPAQDLVELEDL